MNKIKKTMYITISIVIIGIVYSNSFDCQWQFDDFPNIVDNDRIRIDSFDIESLLNSAIFWVGNEADKPIKLSRPVSYMSFSINYYLFGLDVYSFHVVNLIIHCLNFALLFHLIYLLLSRPVILVQKSTNIFFVALLSSLIWAVLPINVQAVTYIVQRMCLLAAFFYLVALIFYVHMRRSNKIFVSVLFFFITSISCLLSYWSKENGLLSILSIVVVEIFFFDGLQRLQASRFKYPVFLLILFAMILLYFSYNQYIVKVLSSYHLRTFTEYERLLTESRILFFYLYQIFIPLSGLYSIEHEYILSTSIFYPVTTLVSILSWSIVVVVICRNYRRYRLACFAVVFYLLNHLIESTIIPLEMIFEHRNYLPSMFLFVVPMLMVMKIKRSSIKIMIVISSIFIYGMATFIRNDAWKTSETLWADALTKSEGRMRPYANLGKYYESVGDDAMALAFYIQGIGKKSDILGYYDGLLFRNIGNIYYRNNNFIKSSIYYKRSLESYRDLYLNDEGYVDSLCRFIDSEGKNGNIESAQVHVKILMQSPIRNRCKVNEY